MNGCGGVKLFFLVFVIISLFYYLNEERSLAILAGELLVFSRVEFSGTQWAKRDFDTHVVLNTRMNF